MLRQNHWLWFLLLLLCVGRLEAQAVRLPYQHYTILDGLVQQQVTALMQDSRGYIWIGTKSGISKFDGEKFENFNLNDVDAGMVCYALFEDHAGNIHAFGSGGTACFNGKIWKKTGSQTIRFGWVIHGTVYGWDSNNKNFWKHLPDTSILIKHIDLQQIKTNTTPLAPTPGVWLAQYIEPQKFEGYFFLCDTLGQISGVTESDNLGFAIYPFNKPNQAYLIKNVSPTGIYSTTPLGVSPPLPPIRFENLSTFSAINCFFHSQHQNEWYIVNQDIFHRKSGALFAEKINIPISHPTKIIEDIDGSVWIGSETGLYHYFPNGFKYIDHSDAPLVWNIIEDHEGKIWMGSYGAGLFIFDGKTIQEKLIPSNVSKFYTKPQFYYGASKDKNGALYFPTGTGIFSYHKGRFQNLSHLHRIHETAILISKYDTTRQQVLVAGRYGLSAYHITRQKLSWLYYQTDNEYIARGLAIDRHNNYWISSRIDIVRINGNTLESKTYSNKNGLPFRSAFSIETDPVTGLWFGAVQGGLYFFDESTEQFRRVAADVIQRPVTGLLAVDSLLVIGEEHGLYVLNLNEFHQKKREHVWVFNHRNGFTGIEPNQNGLMLDSKGNLWIITSNQVAFIHKSKLILPELPSRVRITRINEQTIPYAHTGTILMPYGENDLIVRFESIGAQRTFRTLYSWRLGGAKDMDWSPWSEEPTAYLPQLPNGQYSIEVRSKHPSATDSTAYMTDKAHFQIEVVFYKEPTFFMKAFAGMVLLMLFTTGLIWSYWKERKKAQSARENEIEQERKAQQFALNTAEAEKKLIDRERLAQLHQIRALQSQLNPHFLFNLLNSVKKSIVVGDMDEADDKLDKLAQFLRLTLEAGVESNPDFIGDKAHQVSLQSEINLLKYYIELMASIRKGKFTWSVEVDPALQPHKQFITPMIIQPFVENAIRHGLLASGPRGDGRLLLRFSHTDQGVLCLIRDGGVGFKSQVEEPLEKRKSYGIQLIKDRIRLLHDFNIHIELDMRDNPEGGVEIQILFHLNHLSPA